MHAAVYNSKLDPGPFCCEMHKLGWRIFIKVLQSKAVTGSQTRAFQHLEASIHFIYLHSKSWNKIIVAWSINLWSSMISRLLFVSWAVSSNFCGLVLLCWQFLDGLHKYRKSMQCDPQFRKNIYVIFPCPFFASCMIYLSTLRRWNSMLKSFHTWYIIPYLWVNYNTSPTWKVRWLLGYLVAHPT